MIAPPYRSTENILILFKENSNKQCTILYNNISQNKLFLFLKTLKINLSTIMSIEMNGYNQINCMIGLVIFIILNIRILLEKLKNNLPLI